MKGEEQSHPLNLNPGYSSRKRVLVPQLIKLLLLLVMFRFRTTAGQKCTPYAKPPGVDHCTQMCTPFYDEFPVLKPNPKCIQVQLYSVWPGNPPTPFATMGVLVRLVPKASAPPSCLKSALRLLEYALQAVDQYGYPIGIFFPDDQNQIPQDNKPYVTDETKDVQRHCQRSVGSLFDTIGNREISHRVCKNPASHVRSYLLTAILYSNLLLNIDYKNIIV